MSDDFEEINGRLLQMIPQEQLDRVFSQEMIDIDGEFLGFVEVYWHLAAIIPKHFTVYDLGCAYAPQAFFFEEHARYVGVDLFDDTRRFEGRNTTHYSMKIEDFLAKHGSEIDKDESFAICSYVPPWHGDNRRMVREYFPNCFVFYPHDREGQKRLFAKMCAA